MNVLSLFDGMSCGQIALKELGVKVDNYFAAEIDKHAIQVTKHNFPNTIHLGDVTKVSSSELPKIDLLMGGSPCQGFSFAGKQLAFDDPRSKLFFEFVRLKEELNPKYFLLENVRMAKEHENVITRFMGVEPIYINSALLSAQSRPRVYWTNINAHPSGLFGDLKCLIPQPKDKGVLLRDILENEVPEKYYLSDKMLSCFAEQTKNHTDKGNGFKFNPTTGDKKANCVTSRCYKMGVDDNYIVASRGRNIENPKSRQTGLTTEQQLEPRLDGETNCLTSVQKDNLVMQLNILSNTENLPIFANSKIDNNEKQNKRRPNQTLQALQRIIGTEKDGEWQMAVYARFYENEVLFNELFIGKLQTKKECAQNNKEWEATGSKINTNVEMYDLQRKRWEGCTSHRQKSFKQLIRQFTACLSELPQHDTQKEIALQNLWKSAKRIGILRKALSEVQKIWESFDDKAQSVHRDYRIRRLTPKEAKHLQTIPDWYDMSVVSDTQQYKMLGNGWTIEVIKYILNFAQ